MKPLFLLSVERSGTTFLARAIEGIYSVRAIPEFQLKNHLHRPTAAVDRYSKTDRKARYWRQFLADWPDALPLRDRVTDMVVNSLGESTPATRYWFDHTPSNARNYEMLREAFPEAVWLGLVRDPRGSFTSWSRQPWGVGSVEDFCLAWTYLCGVLDRAREEGVLAGIVYFEKLLTDVESEMTGIARLLDSQWNGLPPAAGFPITGSTAEQHRNVNQMPDTGKILAWRQEIEPDELLRLERILNIQMRRHGYECRTPLRELHDSALLPRRRGRFSRRIRKFLG